MVVMIRKFSKILFLTFAFSGCARESVVKHPEDAVDPSTVCNERSMISPCLDLRGEEEAHASPLYRFYFCSGKEQIALYVCASGWGDCDGNPNNGCESKAEKKDGILVKLRSK